MHRGPRPWARVCAVVMLGAPPLLAQTALPYPPLPADPVLPAAAPGLDLPAEEAVQPAPDVPTVSLAEAVAAALESNYELRLASDDVAVARYRYSAALGQFHPKLTPRYQRSSDDSAMDLSAQQRLPWTGGSLTASASFGSFPGADSLITRSSRLSLTLSQPLLRGFGPNASLFDLRNSRRQRERSERSLELSRQRLAVDVARRFYQVIEQRTLLSVARQSLHRTQNLQRASEARLEVGLVSKLDVYRAQLQASQAQDAMLRAETALQDALEGFRVLLGLHPGAPVEPAAVALTTDLPAGASAPLPVLVQRALATRVDMHETRDQVGDARRLASLARQNLLPQLDLNLGVSKEGFGTSFSSAWTADERVNLFLSASFPVERSADLAEKAVAQLSLAGMERTLRQRELQIESEVRAAARGLEQVRKSVELQQQAVDIAQQQLRLATLRYQRGLASNFDVVDAEGSLVVARSALVSLLARYRVTRLELLKATGELDVHSEFAR